MKFNPKNIFKTPDPKKIPGIKFVMPVMFREQKLGYKIWVKRVVNGELKYIFDAVYFEPEAILEGSDKRHYRYLWRG